MEIAPEALLLAAVCCGGVPCCWLVPGGWLPAAWRQKCWYFSYPSLTTARLCFSRTQGSLRHIAGGRPKSRCL